MIPAIIVYHSLLDNGLNSKSVTQYTVEEELLIKGIGILSDKTLKHICDTL
jgi:hypothetical protein